MNAGLCAACRWMREVRSDKGRVFLRCERARTDPRFRKYPTLPVLACAGFEKRSNHLAEQLRARVGDDDLVR